MEPAVYFENWIWTCGVAIIVSYMMCMFSVEKERLFNFSQVCFVVSIIALAFFIVLRIWI